MKGGLIVLPWISAYFDETTLRELSNGRFSSGI